MWRKLLTRLFTRAFALLLALAPVPGAAQEAGLVELGAAREAADLRVGCIYPMTGRAGILGRDSLVGLKLAFRYMEQQDPGPWPAIHVTVGDSRSRLSTGTRLARSMVDAMGAQILCGVVNSAIAIEVTKIAEQRDVLFVGTDHASSRLTGRYFHDGYFRLTNDTRQSMTAGALYLRDEFAEELRQRPLRIAYLGPDYEYGYQVWADFRAAMEAHDVPYEVAQVFWPRLSEPDYGPYITALLRDPPDIVINSLWGGDLVAFVKQAVETDFFAQMRFANFEKGGDYEVFAALGERMPTGLILSTRHHNNWPETPLNRWFVEAFFREAGYYPSSGAQGAFAGMLAIARAARRAGPPHDLEALKSALRGMEILLPEDPEGIPSVIDPETHQVLQTQAIGVTEANDAYPPAKVMLGQFRSYRSE